MHPYGGTSVCPRCSKPVYAAEQAMGPGRKLYHKPCLACTLCNKRLDSLTLLEHDQQPYCKSCHVKNFGTRDLRQANLPHRPSSPPLNSDSPFPPLRIASPIQRGGSKSPVRVQVTGNNLTGRVTSPILRPNRVLSPTSDRPSPAFSQRESPSATADESDESRDEVGAHQQPYGYTATVTNSGRGLGGFPRTVPLSPTKSGTHARVQDPDSPTKFAAATFGRSGSPGSTAGNVMTVPLVPTATGTRYGAALSGASPIARQWGGTTPQCGRCGKSVYFAEQVKATGKTWHKGCLRCTECSVLLDSKRLTEKDGDPLCHRCYGKLHGPQGSGYALLGKAGG